MDTTMIGTRWYARKPLAALGKLTATALVGMAFLLGYAIVLFGFFPPVVVLMAAALILAGIVATGWRWAPLLGVLVYGGLLALAAPALPYMLTHPSDTFMFAFGVAFLALAIVGVGAGVGATVQNYRSAERPTPRGLAAALAGLCGLALGAILVAAIPRTVASTGVSPEALAELPALTAANFRFDRAAIRARVAETVTLRLENRDTTGHSFDIDELNVHVPMDPGKSALALFKATKPGTYTFYCGVPGHRDGGMVGTLIVAP